MSTKGEDESLPGFRPGYIEVLFNPRFKINIEKDSKHPWGLRSGKGTPPKELVEALERIECSHVARLFTRMNDDRYDKLHERVEEKRKKKGKSSRPNLKFYFVVFFPKTRNQKDAANLLKELCPEIIVESYEVALPSRPGALDDFDLCRFSRIAGRCFRLIQSPGCSGTTPLDEPLVGTTDMYPDPSQVDDNQWYIFRTKTNQAWTMACGKGIYIALADWGFLTTHQDLTNLDMKLAWNTVNWDRDVSYIEPGLYGDCRYHGTAVAGILAGADNNKGIAGIAYGSRIWPIQAGPGVRDSVDTWIAVVDYLNDIFDKANMATGVEDFEVLGVYPNQLPRVLLLEVETLSTYQCFLTNRPALKDGIDALSFHRVIVVLPAGNGGIYIGEDDDDTDVIIVGATDYDAIKNARLVVGGSWGSSNWGKRVDMCAPGKELVTSACRDNGTSDVTDMYAKFGYTSGAAPMVAGTVALMLQCNPNLEPDEVREILISTGSLPDYEPGDLDGHGNVAKPIGKFLNAYAAVREACKRASPEICVYPCKKSTIVGVDDFHQMKPYIPESDAIFDPCKYSYIHYEDCIRQQIIIGKEGGPCTPETLIAAAPFRRDFFEVWKKVDNKLSKGKHIGHFKRLTEKEETR